MIFRSAWILWLGLVFALGSPAQDQENCSICHSLPLLTRIDNEGSLRVLEVDMRTFAHTSHAHVACSDCHDDILGFPHPEEVKPVDCGKACHVNKPYTLTAFSHRLQVELHEQSVHGYDPEDSWEVNEAKPSCKYCHGNRLYGRPQSLIERVNKCRICHLEEGLERMLSHIDRLGEERNARTSQDIVHVCASCHADESKMLAAEVNPTQVAGFEHHFHGKALKRGLDDVAHCADCHTSHNVLPADHPESTIAPANLQQTCTACHENASAEFSRSAIHSEPTKHDSPLVYYVEWGFILLTTITMALLFTHILLDLTRYVVTRLRGPK